MTKTTAPLLVNIGCGSRFHSSWTNFDLHSSSPHVVACDLVGGIPLDDMSADAVYCAALLEHIRPVDVAAFLCECYRVLKPNGRFRIAVPDFERQATEYLSAIKRQDDGLDKTGADREWMITEIVDQFSREWSGGRMAAYLASPSLGNQPFVVERIGEEGRDLIESLQRAHAGRDIIQASTPTRVRGRWLGRRLLKWLLGSTNLESDLAALAIGRFRLSGEVHQWAYDRYSIVKVLREADFSSIQICDHGQSQIKDWKAYCLEFDSQGNVLKPDLLIAECVKL